MVSALIVGLAMGLACSPIHRIPAPEPPRSKVPPTQARAHYARGMIWLARGDLDGAQASLERARVFDPGSPQILAALARVALNRGETGQARERLADAAALADSDPHYWLIYGRLEMAFGDQAVGRNALHRALVLGGGWEVRAALIADELRNSRPSKLLDEWVLGEAGGSVEARRRADLRVAAGDHSGAVLDYLGVLRDSGRDLSLVTPIVNSASQGSRLAWALLEAESICAEQPSASAAWLVVGLISSLLGDAPGTVEAIERAQELGVELGSGPQLALDKARTIEEGSIQGPSGQAPLIDDPVSRAIHLVQQQQWEAGENTLRQSLERNPDDPRLLYILGELHLKRDGPAAAKDPIEKVLAVQPSYGPALNMWAWIHAEQGLELEEAEQRVIEALHMQPQVGSYWDTLGWILHLRGNHTKARLALSRALRLSPKDDTVRAHLDACVSQGKEKAR